MSDPNRPRRARQTARKWGLTAEWIAAVWLIAQGYRILRRRFRAGAGEIDIVAVRGRTVAIVEVKARKDPGTALGAVDVGSRRRICAAARVWLSQNPGFVRHTIRFDIITICPGRWPNHITSAFEALD